MHHAPHCSNDSLRPRQQHNKQQQQQRQQKNKHADLSPAMAQRATVSLGFPRPAPAFFASAAARRRRSSTRRFRYASSSCRARLNSLRIRITSCIHGSVGVETSKRRMSSISVPSLVPRGSHRAAAFRSTQRRLRACQAHVATAEAYSGSGGEKKKKIYQKHTVRILSSSSVCFSRKN